MAGELSATIARFAADCRHGDIPADVLHEGKRALLNAFATALAACREPGVLGVQAVFERFRAPGDCTVIGHARGTDMLHAASLNAMRMNVFDYDDTHIPTILHPTAPVAPALFALAQRRRIHGRDLLAAFVLGVEIECRLANAVSPWHYQRGWHITSTCGVFGAAMAAGSLLGLDAQRQLWALGHAAAQSSGLVETLGTTAKSVGVGNAASNGLLSALLAAEGCGGPQSPLEGARGFLPVMGEAADPAALLDRLGTQWELKNNTYKPYPCGVVLNPVIEACLSLHHRDGVRLADVVAVELSGHPLLRERTDRPPPRSGRESQVSARHAVAVALERGQAGLDAFSDAGVAATAAAAQRLALTFRDDASFGVEAAAVRLQLADGSVRAHHVQVARGSLAQPLADADLEAKLRELCAWGGSGCDAGALIEALWAIDTTDDAGAAMRRSAAPA
ncbi:MAG: MmgE/PrpD family protein [Comamonadaceae bacterium]|nr:MAG: MmgE/PrpD family protein [Comamonadaceae bacterium]